MRLSGSRQLPDENSAETAAGSPGGRPAAPAGEARPGSFAALASPRYRVLFAAGICIFFAVQGQQIARGWLARELTGTNTGLGGVFLGFGVPMLLMTPVSGVIADRFPKRTVLLAAGTLLTGSAMWIAVADYLDVLRYWMLVGSSSLQGVGFSVYGPARVAFTAEVVDRPLLPNAVALTQTGLNATNVVAPAAAGILIGLRPVGTAGVYAISTALMCGSLLLVSRLPRTRPAGAPTGSLLSGFVGGLRYVRSQPRLLTLVVTASGVVMLGFPYMAFLPTVAEELGVGASGYGGLSSAAAVSALAMSILVVTRVRMSQAWRLQAASGLVFSVGLGTLAAAPGYLQALLAMALAGGAASAFQAMNNTLVLHEADLEYHGRVQSLLMLGFSGFGLMALPLGILGDAVGTRWTLLGMGTACLLAVSTSALVQRRLRRRAAPAVDVG